MIRFVLGLSPATRRGFLGLVIASAMAVVGVALADSSAAAGAPTAAPSHDATRVGDGSEGIVTIEIPEVECAGCSLTARQAIKGAGGVRRLSEGNPKNRIVVSYEPGAERPDAYVDALHKAGFAKARKVDPG